MGKKSKRRGGTGGGRKGQHAAGAGADDGEAGDQLTAARAAAATLPTGIETPADALAFLETVQPLASLKGIVSTNDDPGKCALCSGPTVPGGDHTSLTIFCCGKQFCEECHLRENGSAGFALDLLGKKRCTFCNTSQKCILSLSLQKATAGGKAWAQYVQGNIHLIVNKSPRVASLWMIRAAANGHPAAFLQLARLCRGEWGHPRDLVVAQAFAKKARSLQPDLRLASNKALLDIARGYFEDGAAGEVMGILSDIAKETDPDALDGDLCEKMAACAYESGQVQLAGEMGAKAFCHGEIEFAHCAMAAYFLSANYALSKLWLSVACKTKTDGSFQKVLLSCPKERRGEIRSKLREISDSCGGCGAALEGDTRKWCRGCKAFCYCSRECQKLHWNRPDADGGHSSECKEAQDQARKILEAIESGKVDLSKKKTE